MSVATAGGGSGEGLTDASQTLAATTGQVEREPRGGRTFVPPSRGWCRPFNRPSYRGHVRDSAVADSPEVAPTEVSDPAGVPAEVVAPAEVVTPAPASAASADAPVDSPSVSPV